LFLIGVSAVTAAWFGMRDRDPGPTQGAVYQSGMFVGTARGARVSRSDPSVLEFAEIADAGLLNQLKEFEFGDRVLKVIRVHQVQYAPVENQEAIAAPTPGGGTTMLRVVAKIVSTRS
jgi:hypothetical protein